MYSPCPYGTFHAFLVPGSLCLFDNLPYFRKKSFFREESEPAAL